MSLSNYPPGVTGNEYQIAGPDRDWTDERDCEACGETCEHYCEVFDGEWWATCTACGATTDPEPWEREGEWDDRAQMVIERGY